MVLQGGHSCERTMRSLDVSVRTPHTCDLSNPVLSFGRFKLRWEHSLPSPDFFNRPILSVNCNCLLNCAEVTPKYLSKAPFPRCFIPIAPIGRSLRPFVEFLSCFLTLIFQDFIFLATS